MRRVYFTRKYLSEDGMDVQCLSKETHEEMPDSFRQNGKTYFRCGPAYCDTTPIHTGAKTTMAEKDDAAGAYRAFMNSPKTIAKLEAGELVTADAKQVRQNRSTVEERIEKGNAPIPIKDRKPLTGAARDKLRKKFARPL